MHFLGLSKKTVQEMAEKKDEKGLIHALTDKNWVVRQDAAWALGNIGNSRAVKTLVLALRDENNGVRFQAAKALGKIRDITALGSLVQALKDENRNVRMEVALALDNLGWKPSDDVEKAYYLIALEAWSEVVTLGKVAIEPLINAIKDEHYDVQIFAAETLGRIGDVRGIEFLLEALKNKNWDVRSRGAWALGNIGEIRAIEPLTKARTYDLAPDVQRAAGIALEKIAGTYSPPPLQPPKSKFEKDVIRYAEYYCKELQLVIAVEVDFLPRPKETEVEICSDWTSNGIRSRRLAMGFSISVWDTIRVSDNVSTSDIYKEFLKYMNTHPVPDQGLEPKPISDVIELARQKSLRLNFYLDFRQPLPEPGFTAGFNLRNADIRFRGNEIVIKKYDGSLYRDFLTLLQS